MVFAMYSEETFDQYLIQESSQGLGPYSTEKLLTWKKAFYSESKAADCIWEIADENLSVDLGYWSST
jgi:hypothetical protein